MTIPTEQDLAEIFNDVAEYREAFPEQLANLVISSATDIVYVSPEVATLLTKSVAEVKAMVTKRMQWMGEHEKESGFILNAANAKDATRTPGKSSRTRPGTRGLKPK